MLKVEILSVGTELLMGQIANTNAQYISKRFPEMGLGVFYHSVVGDNSERLKKSLYIALERCDVVVTTGGLGPTQDDLTKETIAEALGIPMELNMSCKEQIEEYFVRAGRIMSENNYRQAYFPSGCILMENGMGTAPGCIIEAKYNDVDKVVVMLPGPPKELIPMFDNCVMPYFFQKSNHHMYSKFLKVTGVGESMIEKLIIDVIDGQTNPTIATYAKDGVVTIRITANDEDDVSPEKLVEKTVGDICEILGKNVYSCSNEEPEEALIRVLKEKNLSFSTAESCTGGLISQKITSVSGASQIFRCGAVVYTEDIKSKVIGVPNEVIKEFGVVSSEVAIEMVRGVCALSGADCAVSVTGYAGPTADIGKPVGLVYIGVKYRDTEKSYKFIFDGNREMVRTLAYVNACDLLRRMILMNDK